MKKLIVCLLLALVCGGCQDMPQDQKLEAVEQDVCEPNQKYPDTERERLAVPESDSKSGILSSYREATEHRHQEWMRQVEDPRAGL